MNKAKCTGCAFGGLALIGVSIVALLAGVGYARAQVVTINNPIPGADATCVVNNQNLPKPGDKSSCEAVGGVYTPKVDPIPGKVGVNGNVIVNGDVTVNGSVVSSNGKGGVAEVAPGFVGATDGTHTTVLVGGGVGTTGDFVAVGPKGTTTINGNGATFDYGADGKVVITDPSIVVTNGTSTTKITNGDITNTGNIDTGGTTTTGKLHVTGKSVFDDAVTINTGGNSTTIKGGGATFTDGSGSTTIQGNTVTTGTVTANKVYVGGRDVGATLDNHGSRLTNVEAKNTEQDGRLDAHDATLADHNTRINNVQHQADATDTRLNHFNGSGHSIESWATGVNTDLSSIHGDITGINDHLGVVDNRLDALEGWEGVAKSQISDLYKRNSKAMEGVAMAMAMPSLTLEPGRTFGVSAAWANFSAENAFGATAAVRLSDSWQLQGGVSLGTKEGQFGGRVGATWQH